MRKIKILGTGIYIPDNQVTADELDRKLGKPSGWCLNSSKVNKRHYAANTDDYENSAYMAVKAINNCLSQANISLDEIDCIICASAVPMQSIPCTAAFVKSQLELDKKNIPCFDINSTCLSFLTALDHISYAIDAGRYNKVIIVSSEISVGLDFQNAPETAIMFGDGAAAALITRSNDEAGIIASNMITLTQGLDYCIAKAGGSLRGYLSPEKATKDDYYFKMKGPESYKLIIEHVLPFINQLLATAQLSAQELKLFIPHQASALSLEYLKRKLQFGKGQVYQIIENYGNQIAASIPTCLHLAINDNKIQRGDKIMLCGSSAGISLGGLIMVY